ncbi:XRE family transcriptional regulator [Candidatus Parcubacteria bacterium]|jgi:transcriptional regulator with XRE-family HTH domain|nr:MAG: XRE family transcriptional regulator [Candidatus Parcubacteria bacterium]
MQDDIYSKEHKKLIVRIIQARKEAGLSQVEAAKRLGRSQSYISKMEVGQRKIDVIELKKIARIYDKPLNYFIN